MIVRYNEATYGGNIMKQLNRSTPAEQGVNPAGILAFLQSLQSEETKSELHSFMMIRHGYVIAEGWANPYGPKDIHHLYSLSKSFTSTAIGIAISEGLLSEEDYIKDIFIDYLQEPYQANIELLQVKHLLSMSGGQEYDIFADDMIGNNKDWVKVILDTPIIHEPGSVFAYNTGSTYVLSVILEKATGIKLESYLNSRLYEHLGFGEKRWLTCPLKHNTGGFGLYLRTEDIAKFGLCYLNDGVFEDQQVIPSDWVKKATSPIIPTGNGEEEDTDSNQGYGYQFWRSTHKSYRGDGAFGQFCLCLPEQDVVIVMTSGYQESGNQLDMVWKHLLPAIDDGAKELDEQQKVLNTYLENMEALYPISKIKSKDIKEKRYILDKKYYSFDRIGFELSGNKGAFKFFSRKSRILIPFGLDHYEEGSFTLDRAREKIVSRGAWTSENEFSIYVRYINTPHCDHFKLVFDGIRVKVTIDRNVSISPFEQVVLSGELNKYSQV